ncbi:MAG: ABC transporter ATP-binding protein [Candidatus Woesearchaeota archaeon]
MTKKRVDYWYNLKIYVSFFKGMWMWATLLLLLMIFIQGSYVFENFLLKIILDTIIETDASQGEIIAQTIRFVVAVFIGIIILRMISSFLRLTIVNKVETTIIQRLKKRYFEHIVKLSYRFHTNHKTGSLISRLTRCGSAIESFTDTIVFNFLPFFFKTVWIVVFIWFYSKLTILIILVTMFIFVIFTYWRQSANEKKNLAMNEAEDLEKGFISDVFTNIQSVLLFGKEKTILRKHHKKTEATRKNQLTYWNAWRVVDVGQSFILNVGFILILFLIVHEYLAGRMTVGTTVFIFNSFWSLIGNVYEFAGGLRQVSRSMTDFEDLFAYGREHSEITNIKKPIRRKITKGSVEFENISFSYGSLKAIRNVSLSIKPGEKIALVGQSGSGKSTLVKLLYRLQDVDKGLIKVDGIPIKNYDFEFLRSEMSVVPQEAILFDESIYENIRFSNSQAKRKDVLKALKFAQLDSIIEKLPKKEKTIVGERGVKLSGGEKQRVSIARAILADKKILVLDEATSALDSETEHQIQKDLEKLMKNRTAIIIAHRLSTIMHADRIVVMHKGKIVEIGSHRQLLRKKGHYHKLWQLQKGGFIG